MYKKICLWNVRFVCVYGFFKIYKLFDCLFKFCFIIDIMGIIYYFVGKYISEFLQLFIQNEFILKDIFDVVNWIKLIFLDLFI